MASFSAAGRGASAVAMRAGMPVAALRPGLRRGRNHASRAEGCPMPVNDQPSSVLHVCVTCGNRGDGQAPLGRALHDALAAIAGPEIEIRPAKCLANCDHGCNAAIAAPGKWQYLLRDLSPDLAADLLGYARAYAASANGAVKRGDRPASLARMIQGRMPPQIEAAPTGAAA